MKAKERFFCCFQGGELAGRQEKKVQAELSKHIRILKRSQRQSFLGIDVGQETYQGFKATSPNTLLPLQYRNIVISALLYFILRNEKNKGQKL